MPKKFENELPNKKYELEDAYPILFALKNKIPAIYAVSLKENSPRVTGTWFLPRGEDVCRNTLPLAYFDKIELISLEGAELFVPCEKMHMNLAQIKEMDYSDSFIKIDDKNGVSYLNFKNLTRINSVKDLFDTEYSDNLPKTLKDNQKW